MKYQGTGRLGVEVRGVVRIGKSVFMLADTRVIADSVLPAGDDVLRWLTERKDNCLRIADLKSGDDRAGWIEDGEYYRRAISRIATLTEALLKNRQGYLNILEMRKLSGEKWGERDGYGGRYGALTREEIESVIAAIDKAITGPQREEKHGAAETVEPNA